MAGLWLRKIRRFFGLQGRLERTFGDIYENNGFNGKESVSGPGSDLKQTESLRTALPALFKELNIKTLLDAPCGDFFWMKDASLDLDMYYGGDIVPALINKNQKLYGTEKRLFKPIDITSDTLPKVDAIFCRDCLVHLPLYDIQAALDNFKNSGATWLLTTTFTKRKENPDIQAGQWRPINLEAPPFNWPAPQKLINEKCTEITADGGTYEDKNIGVWKLK
jgi:hypothetical protein